MGLIAVTSAILALFTPRIFLFLPLLIAVALVIAGFFRGERLRFISAAAVGSLLLLIAAASNYKATHEVTYVVSGSGAASLTYQSEGGSEQQEVLLPWRKHMVKKSGEFLYLSAQNRNDDDICQY